MTKVEFLSRLKEEQLSQYSYTELPDTFLQANKITILCPTHGPFEQRAQSHLLGQGCPTCAKTAKGSEEKILSKLLEKHEGKIKLVSPFPRNQKERVTFECSTHGTFESTLRRALLWEHGCPMCAQNARNKKQRWTWDQVKEKASEKHGGRYTYPDQPYTNTTQKISIICPEHGEFSQRVRWHLQGKGCPRCANEKSAQKRSMSLKTFLARAAGVHGDKYSYTQVEYQGSKEKVKILCSLHGEFEQTPNNHLRGAGCPKCANLSKTLSTEDFISGARAVHEDTYDYSKVEYKHSQEKVRIVCSLHGEFDQTPTSHLQGSGCHKCATEARALSRTLSTEDFISGARAVHGDKFDYTQVEYKSSQEKVKIVCSLHGEFDQTPASHLQGSGCPKCGTEATALSPDEFISRALNIHGDAYDYSKVEYTNSKEKVRIVCSLHGEFEQTPDSHLRGRGCLKCGTGAVALNQTLNTDEFISRALNIHGDAYDYSKVEYKHSQEKVRIVCSLHGEFEQTPDSHLRGRGCLKCGTGRISRAEDELKVFLESLVPPDTVRTQVCMSMDSVRRYLDLAVPSLGLGVEFNGLYWHSEERGKTSTYHSEKSQICLDNGYKDIVHIFEDDWLHRRWAVEHLLKYKLCELPSLMARKLTVGNVEHKAARSFYSSYHMQGPSISAGQLHYGLYQQDELVAVMSFTQHSSGRRKLEAGHWELVRFASKYRVQGGASKLFKAFTREHSPQSVLSFSWSHLFNGNVYQVLGFKLDKELPPDYTYVDKKQHRRLHKAGFQHSRLRLKFGDGYDPTLTEKQNCENNGYYRIYDCGKKRWVWTP